MAGKRPPKPVLSAALREKRDKLIIDMFLIGHTQQSIAQHPNVQLTQQRVHQIILDEMERGKEDQLLRNANAMSIYLSRLEILIREAMTQVVGGDLKAMEVARRLLEQQGKLYGLVVNGPAGRSNVIPPISDNDLEPDDDLDELTAYRMSKPKPVEDDKEAQ